jgi:hypothetical protein
VFENGLLGNIFGIKRDEVILNLYGSAHKSFVENPEGRRQLGKPRHRYKEKY